jgi:hypothetical protein
LRSAFSSQEVEKGTDPASAAEEAKTPNMANLETGLLQTTLEWHSAEETPPLHIVEYAGESWLQSEPLLLVNAAGKMAIGYCQQEDGGCPKFEVGASGTGLGEISLWAIVQVPLEQHRLTTCTQTD